MYHDCERMEKIIDKADFVDEKAQFGKVLPDNLLHHPYVQRVGYSILHHSYKHKRDARLMYEFEFDVVNRLLDPWGVQIVTNFINKQNDCDYILVQKKNENKNEKKVGLVQ